MLYALYTPKCSHRDSLKRCMASWKAAMSVSFSQLRMDIASAKQIESDVYCN